MEKDTPRFWKIGGKMGELEEVENGGRMMKESYFFLVRQYGGRGGG